MKQSINKLSNPILLDDEHHLLNVLFDYQRGVRDSVRLQVHSQSAAQLGQVVERRQGDYTYAIDKRVEENLSVLGASLEETHTVKLVAEGVGQRLYSHDKNSPELTVIVDPIDGTRGIMTDMYSAWVLTGIAEKAAGTDPTIDDISIAVMTEIPPSKQGIGSVVYAVKGKGAYEEQWDFSTNEMLGVRRLTPSTAKDLNHGFGVIAQSFTGRGKRVFDLSVNVMERLLGDMADESLVFNDQVLCSASQMQRVADGKYRFFADLTPLEGKGQCSHPYDLAAPVLIAREAGALVTNMVGGENLGYPLDTETDCGVIAYANQHIRDIVEPVLLDEIAKLS